MQMTTTLEVENKMGKFQIINAGKNRSQTSIKGLIYGDSGVGKSFLAATAPAPLVLLTEMNGQASVSHSNPKADIIHITSANMLAAVLRDIDENPDDYKKYQTIVIDSLTETQRMIKDRILARKKEGAAFAIQDWGKLASDMRAMVRRIRNLKKDVICICLLEFEIEESTGIRHLRPAFDGRKTGAEIAQYFNFVGFLYAQQQTNEKTGTTVTRSLMIEGPSRVMCKPCHPVSGIVDQPNISKIFAQIKQ
tara:strand:+ start:8942 stop:9691 length:750 start_codon:yes stop_codon:yes gene_type:complete